MKIGASGAEMGLSWLLQRIVGATRAAALVLTGRRVDGDEASLIGLVLETVANDALLDTAYAYPLGGRPTDFLAISMLSIDFIYFI